MSSGDRVTDLDAADSCQKTRISKLSISGVHFKNWAGTYSCSPELFFAPKTKEEIIEIVRYAREENRKVRVVGCGHSPSDIACSDDIMISLQYFNKVIEIDRSSHRVKIEAGAVIKDLNRTLYSHNLALSVLGSISDVTVGGAICTATHGSGINYGTLSSYVTEIVLLTSTEKIVTCSSTENEDLFLAAACSLGCLGIILNVTLQCEPAFNLQQIQYGLGLKDVLENLDVHINGSDHFKFTWFPYTEDVVVSHSTRTELVPVKESRAQQFLRCIWEYGIGYYALEFFYYVSTFYPRIVPTINRLYYNLMFSISSTRVDRSYNIFNFECLFKQYVNEWAIPKEKTGVVLWQLREWIESNPEIPVHFPVEVRFVKADGLMISPATGRDSCYVNIIMYRPYGKDVPYQQYWAAYEKIMIEAGGRPHWAKAHSITSENFQSMYPNFRNWCRMQQKVDPIQMFRNSYIIRILS